MDRLSYGYRVIRRRALGGGLSVAAMLANLGIGRAPERAVFDEAATWEALTRADPSVRTYLTTAGFGPGPEGPGLPAGWAPAGRGAYQALQRRLRDGLARHAPTERPGDAFHLETFLSKVPDSIPRKGHVPTVGTQAGMRETGERRGAWGVALILVAALICGGLYLAADAFYGVPGAPMQVAARVAVESGLLEALGQDALIEELRAEGLVPEASGIDPDDPGVTAMRSSLEALRARQ